MPDTYDPAALRALATEVSAAAADILALRQPKYETRKRIAQFQREAPATVLALLDRVALAEAALAALATWVARALPNGAQQMMEDVLADIAALDGGSPEMAAMDALGRALRAAREEVSRDA